MCRDFIWHAPVEILIVGGAAGLVTGVLGPERATGDIDVMDYRPADAMAEVELLAERIGKEIGLPEGWFNSNVQIRADSLPDGWAQRRIFVERGLWLSVYAVSRKDLLAMKFLAHRPKDLEDIDRLGVSEDDKEFVRQYLQQLPTRGTDPRDVAEAIGVLELWKVKSP